MTIRVLIADDQELVRAGFELILQTITDDIEVIGQAADGNEAVRLARSLRPDVCLFDVRMPGMDGVEATRCLAGPEVEDPMAVVVITTFDLDEYVYGALNAGARGFLLKRVGPEMLVQAIRAAAAGDALIAPSITARLLDRFADQTPDGQDTVLADPLSEREAEVLTLVAAGLTNTEIASELAIAVSTVKSHLVALRSKIGVRNRVEIAIWAYKNGKHPAKRGR